MHLSKQTIPELEEVIIGDILAIECDSSGIDADDLDSREDYPKLELVEQTKEIEISGKSQPLK